VRRYVLGVSDTPSPDSFDVNIADVPSVPTPDEFIVPTPTPEPTEAAGHDAAVDAADETTITPHNDIFDGLVPAAHSDGDSSLDQAVPGDVMPETPPTTTYPPAPDPSTAVYPATPSPATPGYPPAPDPSTAVTGGWPSQATSADVYGAPAAPKAKSKLPLIIGGSVLGLLVIGGAIAALGGGGGGLDATKALAGVEALIDDAEFNDETGSAELSRCPLASRSDISDAIDELSSLDSELRNEGITYVDSDETNGLQCSKSEGDDFAGFIVSPYPDDEDYLDWIESTIDNIKDVDAEDPVSYEGGQIYRYCVDFKTDEGSPFCSVDWVAKGLTIGDYVSGDDSDSFEDLEIQLKALLPTIVEKLASEAPTDD
jgi:hypothetical protein